MKNHTRFPNRPTTGTLTALALCLALATTTFAGNRDLLAGGARQKADDTPKTRSKDATVLPAKVVTPTPAPAPAPTVSNVKLAPAVAYKGGPGKDTKLHAGNSSYSVGGSVGYVTSGKSGYSIGISGGYYGGSRRSCPPPPRYYYRSYCYDWWYPWWGISWSYVAVPYPVTTTYVVESPTIVYSQPPPTTVIYSSPTPTTTAPATPPTTQPASYLPPSQTPSYSPPATQPTGPAPQSVAPPTPAPRPMTVSDVKALAKAKLSDDTIIAQIRTSGTVFHLTTAEIVDLMESGVSEAVIQFMINTANPPPPTAPPPK